MNNDVSADRTINALLNDINKFELALRQIEQISLEKMKSSDDETWKVVNEIATKALWPV